MRCVLANLVLSASRARHFKPTVALHYGGMQNMQLSRAKVSKVLKHSCRVRMHPMFANPQLHVRSNSETAFSTIRQLAATKSHGGIPGGLM